MTRPGSTANNTNTNRTSGANVDLADLDLGTLVRSRELQDIFRELLEDSGGGSGWIAQALQQIVLREQYLRGEPERIEDILRLRSVRQSHEAEADPEDLEEEDETQLDDFTSRLMHYYQMPAQEIPFRRILPRSPPPSPLPNPGIAAGVATNTAPAPPPLFMNNRPLRPQNVPRSSLATHSVLDADGCGSPPTFAAGESPFDRNNELESHLPATAEFLQRYGQQFLPTANQRPSFRHVNRAWDRDSPLR